MNKFKWLGRFALFMLKRFVEDRGTHTAGTLAYTTLISLVPLLAVSLSFLAIFSDLKTLSDEILGFIFINFVPASKEVILQYIGEFASKATGMSTVGLLVLIVTALMMMSTIDASLNRIWRVRAKRDIRSRILVYWLVLTSGPMLIGIGIGLTSYLVSLPLINEAATPFGGKKAILEFMPYVLETSAFVLLYLIVPNRRIQFRHALAGGIVAAILFESAKSAFAWYVTTFPTYEAIYGALAVIPIFLVWVYVSWLVILLGAEFACCLDVYRGKSEIAWESHEVQFVLAVRVLGYMWLAQQDGRSLKIRDLLRHMPTVDEESLRDVMLILKASHFVEGTSDRRWILNRDLDEVSLLDLYRIGNFALPQPDGKWVELDPWSRRLSDALVDIERQIEGDMAVSLKSLYRSTPESRDLVSKGLDLQETVDEEIA